MRKTIRLYRQHDMDLINLYRRKHFNFKKEMKNALVAYASGRIYEIVLPDEEPEGGYVPKVISIQLSLNPQKEDEANLITLINNAKNGFKNSFLKTIFRASLPTLPLSSFGINSGFKVKKLDVFDYTLSKKVSGQNNTDKNSAEENDDIKEDKTEADNIWAIGESVAEENVKTTAIDESATEETSEEAFDMFMQMDALTH